MYVRVYAYAHAYVYVYAYAYAYAYMYPYTRAYMYSKHGKSTFWPHFLDLQKLSLPFSESTRKILQNGGVESLWGAI